MINALGWEQALLGSVLADPTSIEEADGIVPSDFSTQSHVKLWEAIQTLHRRGGLDLRAVIHSIDVDRIVDPEEDIRGEAYLRKLIDRRGTQVNEYADQVIKASTRRQMLNIGGLIAAEAQDARIPLEEAVEHAEKRIMELRRFRNNQDGISIGELSDILGKRISGMRDGTIKPAYTPQIINLKAKIGYVDEDDFVIIAARPGEGKSSLIRYEIFHTAMRGEPTAVFNLENGDLEYPKYFVSMRTGINSAKLRSPNRLTHEEFEAVQQAIRELYEIPLYIVWASNVSEVAAKSRRGVRKFGYKSVWVDYLQLLSNTSENRVQDISMTTRGLRQLAKELKIPVFAASQLNRAVEQRADRKPTLSDLRESGSIEQDATMVWFIEHQTNSGDIGAAAQFPENRLENGMIRPELVAFPMKINVAKNRNGPTGYTEMIKWVKPANQFQSLVREAHENISER